MIVFESLCRLAEAQGLGYQRTLEQKSKKYWGVHLSAKGIVLKVEPLAEGTTFCVPERTPHKHNHSTLVDLCCDDVKSTFGLTAPGDEKNTAKAIRCLASAAEIYSEAAKATKHPPFRTIAAFYQRLVEGEQEVKEEWLGGSKYVFVYKGEVIGYNRKVHDFVVRYHSRQVKTTQKSRFCCVTGEETPVSLIPALGVNGFTTYKAKIFSCNIETCKAYGWGEKGTPSNHRFLNVPVGAEPAMQIPVTLQWLKATGCCISVMKGVSVFCWTEKNHPVTHLGADLFRGGEAEEADELRQAAYCELLRHPEWADEDTETVYMLGVTVTEARMAITWWDTCTVSALTNSFKKYVEGFSDTWTTKEGVLEARIGVPFFQLFGHFKKYKQPLAVVQDTLRSLVEGKPLPDTYVREHLRIQTESIVRPRYKTSYWGLSVPRLITRFIQKDNPMFSNIPEDEKKILISLGRLCYIYEQVRRAAVPGTTKFDYLKRFLVSPKNQYGVMRDIYLHHHTKLEKQEKYKWLDQVRDTILEEIGTVTPLRFSEEEKNVVTYGYYLMDEEAVRSYEEHELAKKAKAAEAKAKKKLNGSAEAAALA